MISFDKDTKTMKIIAKDTGDFVIDIGNYLLDTGDKVYFTVNNELEKQNPKIAIEITEFINHKAVVHLSSENTDLTPGNYLYDIQVNAADGRVDTVLGPAKFKVMGGVKF